MLEANGSLASAGGGLAAHAETSPVHLSGEYFIYRQRGERGRGREGEGAWGWCRLCVLVCVQWAKEDGGNPTFTFLIKHASSPCPQLPRNAWATGRGQSVGHCSGTAAKVA